MGLFMKTQVAKWVLSSAKERPLPSSHISAAIKNCCARGHQTGRTDFHHIHVIVRIEVVHRQVWDVELDDVENEIPGGAESKVRKSSR